MGCYHVECFKKKFPNGSAVGRPATEGRERYCYAKFAPEGCSVRESGEIKAGELVTWQRRSKRPRYTPMATPTPVAAAEPIPINPPEAHPDNAQPAPAPMAPASNDPMAALALALVPHLAPHFAANAPEIDIQELIEKIRAQLASPRAIKIDLIDKAANVVASIDRAHKLMPRLLRAVQARKADGTRVNVWLAGPSGSGKTTAAHQVAKALGLKFYYTGAVNDAYALMGYKDAHGQYVRTLFREAYEHGGVFLWDEVDGSDPNALVAFNAALANGCAAFPDGMVDRHPDFICIAAANTWGHGATREYVGRNKIDSATLKRFAFIDWDYDETLELETAPNRQWALRVQQIRAKVRERGIRVLVTPRETYEGAALLATGLTQEEVEDMTIRSGMTPEQWNSLL